MYVPSFSKTFNFSFNDIIIFGIAINITAALGAYIFGFIEDRIGIKKVILTSLVLLIFVKVVSNINSHNKYNNNKTVHNSTATTKED